MKHALLCALVVTGCGSRAPDDGPVVRLDVTAAPPPGAPAGLLLRITSPAASNCASPPTGAGITGLKLWIENALQCEPLTIKTPDGPYVVSCASPSVMACVEPLVDLAVIDIAPGEHKVFVLGLVNALEAWGAVDLVVVPEGVSLVHTIRLSEHKPAVW